MLGESPCIVYYTSYKLISFLFSSKSIKISFLLFDSPVIWQGSNHIFIDPTTTIWLFLPGTLRGLLFWYFYYFLAAMTLITLYRHNIMMHFYKPLGFSPHLSLLFLIHLIQYWLLLIKKK